jgi:hypothetical protein
MGHAFFGNLNTFTTARISTYARRAMAYGKTSKTSDFDAIAFDQGVVHGIQNSLHGKFGVTVGQLAKTVREFFYKVGACHGRCRKKYKAIDEKIWSIAEVRAYN